MAKLRLSSSALRIVHYCLWLANLTLLVAHSVVPTSSENALSQLRAHILQLQQQLSVTSTVAVPAPLPRDALPSRIQQALQSFSKLHLITLEWQAQQLHWQVSGDFKTLMQAWKHLLQLTVWRTDSVTMRANDAQQLTLDWHATLDPDAIALGLPDIAAATLTRDPFSSAVARADCTPSPQHYQQLPVAATLHFVGIEGHPPKALLVDAQGRLYSQSPQQWLAQPLIKLEAITHNTIIVSYWQPISHRQDSSCWKKSHSVVLSMPSPLSAATAQALTAPNRKLGLHNSASNSSNTRLP
ncbi:hypothetical protein [Idiomarina tyrosinivorans]|uniref:hypothetical protein n=1 Tax=Idiomarina tyrosinivorans TaxID=1445662 RepID=UPI001F546F26|nr:hypothetical protein [Idiomarina tyrosinivorans]